MPETCAAFAVDPNSHSARMLRYLREILHVRQMRYAEVAGLMGVSEKSIKRYMTGRGVTLPVLERLCATVGMSLGELSALVREDEEGQLPWTTDTQEAVLATEPRLAIIVALLSNGWTATRIEREGLIGLSDMNAILARLDRLGVLQLYPNNRIRLRSRLRSIDIASEPLRRVIAEAGARVIANLDPFNPLAIWRLNYARLGPASVARVTKRLEAFLSEVSELGRQDMDLAGDQVKWFAVCGMVTEHEILGLRLLQNDTLQTAS